MQPVGAAQLRRQAEQIVAVGEHGGGRWTDVNAPRGFAGAAHQQLEGGRESGARLAAGELGGPGREERHFGWVGAADEPAIQPVSPQERSYVHEQRRTEPPCRAVA